MLTGMVYAHHMSKVEIVFIAIGAIFLVFVLGVCVEHKVEQNRQNVTVCQSKTQTHCLWIDGHAEWR